MKKIFFKLKFVVYLFICIFFHHSNSVAEILKKIDVLGNDRLSTETIILFSELKIGEDLDSISINNAFKNLYETNYFKDLKINFSSGILKIEIIENPIIQIIEINGIKNKSILRELKKIGITKVTLFADAEVVTFYKRQGWVLEPKGSKCAFWYAN